MNRPLKHLSRRGFLGGLVIAPMAAKAGAVKALMAKVEETAAIAAAGTRVAAAGGGMHGVYRLINNPALMAAYKTGLLPGWVKHEVEGEALSWNGAVVLPDIAALRSVSLSSKLRMSRAAMIARVWASVDDMHAMEMARKAFLGDGVDAAPKPAGGW